MTSFLIGLWSAAYRDLFHRPEWAQELALAAWLALEQHHPTREAREEPAASWELAPRRMARACRPARSAAFLQGATVRESSPDTGTNACGGDACTTDSFRRR